jgi:hypothetical protein
LLLAVSLPPHSFCFNYQVGVPCHVMLPHNRYQLLVTLGSANGITGPVTI